MSKAQIKVLIIGKDGVARKHWVDHDAEFYDNKYKLDMDAVYQSAEGWWIFSKTVPTIMFRENSVIAVSAKTKATHPEPDEMGASISRAAWAIAELMRKQDEQFQMILMALVILSIIISGAGAYMAFTAGKNVNDLRTQIDVLTVQINGMATTIQNQNPALPGGSPIPSGIPIPIITVTPVPGISVT